MVRKHALQTLKEPELALGSWRAAVLCIKQYGWSWADSGSFK